MPKFKDTVSWQQAELLMQPAFIRVIDHIRQQLDKSSWKGTYQEFNIWPDNTTDEIKTTVNRLQEELLTADAAQSVNIQQALSNLPSAYPGYNLCLQHDEQLITIDIWQLCYQICFRNWNPSTSELENQKVEIDTSLIDETGDVDWERLDAKTGQIVNEIFSKLPE